LLFWAWYLQFSNEPSADITGTEMDGLHGVDLGFGWVEG
jgi:hypothetical protein